MMGKLFHGFVTHICQMRILLHLGSPKTGTTALQARMTGCFSELTRQGVLYPRVSSHPISHHFLSFMLREKTGLPRLFRQLYRDHPAWLARDFARDWNQVKAQVRKHAPHTLVLSSESLYVATDVERGPAFRDMLRSLSPEISLVAYIRRPSQYYLSRIQQDLKSSSTFAPPGPINFRQRIEFFETLFGQPAALVAYNRENLHQGDITADFIHRFLPDTILSAPDKGSGVNETLSAESMSLLQEYRRINHPVDDYEIFPGSIRFRMALQNTEREEGLYIRPVLHPGVTDYIDHATIDLIWLRDTRGFVFSGIDYDRLGRSGVEWPSFQSCKRVADVCEVDEDRKAEILMRTIKAGFTLSNRIPPGLERWLKRRAGNRGLHAIRAALHAVKRRLPI